MSYFLNSILRSPSAEISAASAASLLPQPLLATVSVSVSATSAAAVAVVLIAVDVAVK